DCVSRDTRRRTAARRAPAFLVAPAGRDRPLLGRNHDQIARLSLDVRIAADIAQLVCETPLELCVRGDGVRMLAQIVAEQERVAQVRATVEPNVNVRRAL